MAELRGKKGGRERWRDEGSMKKTKQNHELQHSVQVMQSRSNKISVWKITFSCQHQTE